ERSGNRSIVIRQRDRPKAVPPLEVSHRPAERLVEVTQVAGVWAPGAEHCLHRRAADLMAADGLQQTIRRVRHVTVVADAAGRPSAVVRVGADVSLNLLVALEARLVRLSARGAVTGAPGLRRARVVGGLMRRVAR